MRHTIVKPRYMKNQSEISWQFPAHPLPQQLRNYNKQANMISFQIAQARRAWAISNVFFMNTGTLYCRFEFGKAINFLDDSKIGTAWDMYY